jgi:tetratricopeptide (TPR) repeat protein
LKAIVDDKSGELIVDTMQPFADIVIGHRMASQTKIPNKCLADGTVIWDCPGFNDTDPVQEIANSFYIKKLFETTYEVKFVLVVPEHYLVRDKGNHFLATLSSFMKTFSNIEAIDDSVSLVITQVTAHKQPQHIKNSIEQILADNESVTERQKILVNKLINSSLHLFHKPKDEGEFNVVNPFEAMEGLSQYIKGSPDIANMSISMKALECALPLFSTAGSNFNKILEIMTKAILEATDCLKANPNNLFAQNYHIIKDMVPIAISHKNLPLHQENEHFPELDLLFGLQKILGSNQAGSMLEGLNVLQQALEAIAEYSGSGNIALKNQVQDYAYCLKQQYEYVKFFSGICGKELPAAHLTELLQLCGAKVAENLEFQVSSLHIDQSQLDADYYHKAIGYLEQYPNSKPCIKLKSLCYSGLAGIAEHNGDSDGAIGCYVKAIETSKHQPEIYEKLGKLFFSKGQYAKAIEAYKVVNNEFDIKLCFKQWLGQEPRNPNIMLKQAEYFESIGLFESAKKSYHHAFSLSKNENIKVSILEKIGNIMVNSISQGQNFIIRAEEHDLYNYDLVDAEFIHNLFGDAAIFDNFHA